MQNTPLSEQTYLGILMHLIGYLNAFNLGTLMHLLDKTMAPHSNTLAWKIQWTEEPIQVP